MTRLFRSKSCGLPGIASSTELNKAIPSLIAFDTDAIDHCEGSGESEDEDKEEPDAVAVRTRSRGTRKQRTQVVLPPGSKSVTCSWKNHIKSQRNYYDYNFSYNYQRSGHPDGANRSSKNQQAAISMVDVLMAALRKSLVTCRVVPPEDIAADDSSIVDISWPTEVRHVSNVTFDRFDGFLGLPTELEPHVPKRVPSASASVFGVSPKSMQCSFDERGNSVPTILVMMQKQLYSGGGLKVEGIFRINANDSQEEYVRKQLNLGVVPHGIDVHCLASMIKAWLRELPLGVLDTLTPEQLRCCNTEDEYTQVLDLLPPVEAALFDWAINLMADVVQHESYNKMNARNIAMVFAPNMTQMADPLTALIHAVQVMNFLKTLILKTIRDREERLAAKLYPQLGCSLFSGSDNGTHERNSNGCMLHDEALDACCQDDGGPATRNNLRTIHSDKLDDGFDQERCQAGGRRESEGVELSEPGSSTSTSKLEYGNWNMVRGCAGKGTG